MMILYTDKNEKLFNLTNFAYFEIDVNALIKCYIDAGHSFIIEDFNYDEELANSFLKSITSKIKASVPTGVHCLILDYKEEMKELN